MAEAPSPGVRSDLAWKSQTHELKCWPEFFIPLLNGEKTFELRKDDRGYRVGDELWLREWRPMRFAGTVREGEYTGREIRRVVTYILAGVGLEAGLVCMALRDASEGSSWRPIASAPKDGTFILVANDDINGMGIACWNHPHRPDEWSDGEYSIVPTHWMPLPPAPPPEPS